MRYEYGKCARLGFSRILNHFAKHGKLNDGRHIYPSRLHKSTSNATPTASSSNQPLFLYIYFVDTFLHASPSCNNINTILVPSVYSKSATTDLHSLLRLQKFFFLPPAFRVFTFPALQVASQPVPRVLVVPQASSLQALDPSRPRVLSLAPPIPKPASPPSPQSSRPQVPDSSRAPQHLFQYGTPLQPH